MFNSSLKKQYFEYLEKEFSVLFTFHSNRIEGVNTTLTLNDTKRIINNTYDFKSIIDINKKREINETINHQNVFTKPELVEKRMLELKNMKKRVTFNCI